MNPLKRQQQELLERIGCADLARKINELVKYTNDYGKITLTQNPEYDDELDELALNTWGADTRHDAKMMIKDFLKKERKIKS